MGGVGDIVCDVACEHGRREALWYCVVCWEDDVEGEVCGDAVCDVPVVVDAREDGVRWASCCDAASQDGGVAEGISRNGTCVAGGYDACVAMDDGDEGERNETEEAEENDDDGEMGDKGRKQVGDGHPVQEGC